MVLGYHGRSTVLRVLYQADAQRSLSFTFAMERRPSFAKLKPAARSFTGRYQTHMVLLKENSREGKEPREVPVSYTHLTLPTK